MEQITVVGFDELASGSQALFERIGDEAARAFEQTAQAKGDQASGRMPRETGHMAGSVLAALELSERRATVGIFKSEVPYAGFVEFGGIRNRPYVPEGRYLFPAALDAEQELGATGESVAEDEIRRQRWESPKT